MLEKITKMFWLSQEERLEEIKKLSKEELSLILITFLQVENWDFQAIKNILDKNMEKQENWEILTPKLYWSLKSLEKYLKKLLKELEQPTKDVVEADPSEFPEFSISVRKTFDFKENKDYFEEYQKLKELESKLKTASEMNLKWETYVDADWVIVEPVPVKFNEILTYKPKK